MAVWTTPYTILPTPYFQHVQSFSSPILKPDRHLLCDPSSETNEPMLTLRWFRGYRRTCGPGGDTDANVFRFRPCRPSSRRHVLPFSLRFPRTQKHGEFSPGNRDTVAVAQFSCL